MDLADARHMERSLLRALADLGLLRRLRLDVDDDVRLGKRAPNRILDGVGGGVSLGDSRAGRDADDDVDEVPSGRLPQTQPMERTSGTCTRIARRAVSTASAGARSMSTSMLRPMRRRPRSRRGTATKSAATESPCGQPSAAAVRPAAQRACRRGRCRSGARSRAAPRSSSGGQRGARRQFVRGRWR